MQQKLCWVDTISCQEIFFIADSMEVKERPFHRARSFSQRPNMINSARFVSTAQQLTSPFLRLCPAAHGVFGTFGYLDGHSRALHWHARSSDKNVQNILLPSWYHLAIILYQKVIFDIVWQFSCVCVCVHLCQVNEVTGGGKMRKVW